MDGNKKKQFILLGVLSALVLVALWVYFGPDDSTAPVEKEVLEQLNPTVEEMQKQQEARNDPEPPPAEPREKKKTVNP